MRTRSTYWCHCSMGSRAPWNWRRHGKATATDHADRQRRPPHIRSGHSFPALTADRGAVAVTEFDDPPSAGRDQQAGRSQANRWIGAGGLDPGRAHDLVAALGDARLTQAKVAHQILDPHLAGALTQALVALADHPAHRRRDRPGRGCARSMPDRPGTARASNRRQAVLYSAPSRSSRQRSQALSTSATRSRTPAKPRPTRIPPSGSGDAVQCGKRLRPANLLRQRSRRCCVEPDGSSSHGRSPPSTPSAGEQRRRALRPRGADHPLVSRLVLAHRGQCLHGQRRPDLALRVAEPDECPQQRRGPCSGTPGWPRSCAVSSRPAGSRPPPGSTAAGPPARNRCRTTGTDPAGPGGRRRRAACRKRSRRTVSRASSSLASLHFGRT